MWNGLLVLLLVLILSPSIPAQTETDEEENSEDIAEYALVFTTSRETNDGTEGDAMLKMFSDDGNTGKYPLGYKGSGPVFNAGSVDRFNISDIGYIGPICNIILWSNADSIRDPWKLQSLSVIDGKTGDKAVFAVEGRIGTKRKQYIRTDKADGQWGAWEKWSACMGSCPTGTHSRQRSCSHPPPSCGGGPCVGVPSENASCSLPNCSAAVTEKTEPATESNSVSIIIPIVIAVVVLVIVIAVLILKRRKSRRDEDMSPEKVKEKDKHENVVTYDKMEANRGMNPEENKYVTRNDHSNR